MFITTFNIAQSKESKRIMAACVDHVPQLIQIIIMSQTQCACWRWCTVQCMAHATATTL